jgi:hypothetical protein
VDRQAIFGRTHEDIAVLIVLPYVEFLMAHSNQVTPHPNWEDSRC